MCAVFGRHNSHNLRQSGKIGGIFGVFDVLYDRQVYILPFEPVCGRYAVKRVNAVLYTKTDLSAVLRPCLASDVACRPAKYYWTS